jgi:plastocyanin
MKPAVSLKILFVLIIGTSFVVGTLGLTLLSVTTPTTDVYGQAGSAVQNIKATYAVLIVPGAAQRTNPIHYYPPIIAVPMGTTVAWLNNDPEQPHTVTSGLPGASHSGALFNSGIMPPGGPPFQYTFDSSLAGSFPYHCEIHPWRVGIVNVNALKDKGTNFVFASGVGPTWNITKYSRTLVDFTPITIPLDLSTPISYNISMFNNSPTNPSHGKVFSKTFVVPGDKLPLELIAAGYLNKTRVYGPDFSSSGAYHLEAPFFKKPANYTVRVQIAAINGKQTQNKIADDFSLKTIT